MYFSPDTISLLTCGDERGLQTHPGMLPARHVPPAALPPLSGFHV